MIYIYHCYRGAHLSIVAAALHLKSISADSDCTKLMELEYFDRLQNQDMGIPVLAGYEDGNPVYFVGLGRGSKIFARFVDSLTGELKVTLKYKSVDCLPCLNMATRIGGFISRYKMLKSLGRRLAAWGVHRNLKKLNTLVLQAKQS